MRRRPLYLAILLLIGTSTVGCRAMLEWWITPTPFDTHTPPRAPDYADLASWAAHPDVSDPADLVPPGSGAVDRQVEAEVDVFFIHPTTYYKGEHFNAPWDDPDAAEITDTGVMATQASSFNGAGRIFAPYYRQMALGGYFTPDKAKGLELAYADVERAFDHWLTEWSGGRPFILASHSQGSRHAQTLLHERFSGEEGRTLRERLVAAYLIGGWIPEAKLGGELPLPACEAAQDTGCLIGWRTVSADASLRSGFDELESPETNLCVNPLSWTRKDTRAPSSEHLGALPLGQNDRNALPPVTVEMLGARCSAGQLVIDPPPQGDGWEVLVRQGNFHVYDYALFTMNIRANAQRRVAAYLVSEARR
ncbi:MAG: DUF3089 domain-containing protein [bacterium]|nr:DUF3089 domain-containing protein [bacterium]MCP5065501.1 DUF3089 domain-containing protein [bacterium]